MKQAVFRIFLLILAVTNLSISQGSDGVTYLPYEEAGSAFTLIRDNYKGEQLEAEENRIKALKSTILTIRNTFKTFKPNIKAEAYTAAIPMTEIQTGWMCVAHAIRNALLAGLQSRVPGIKLPEASELYYYFRFLQKHYIGETSNDSLKKHTIKNMQKYFNGTATPCEPCENKSMDYYEDQIQDDQLGIFTDLIFFALKINGIPIKINGKYAKIFPQHYLSLRNLLFFNYNNQDANYAEFPLIASNLATLSDNSQGNTIDPSFLKLTLSNHIPTVALLNTSSAIMTNSGSKIFQYTGGPVGHDVFLAGYEQSHLIISDSINLGTDTKKLIKVPMSNFLKKVDGLIFILGVNVQQEGKTNLIKFVDYNVDLKKSTSETINNTLRPFNLGYPEAPKN